LFGVDDGAGWGLQPAGVGLSVGGFAEHDLPRVFRTA
jgi:hypothetical protein